MAVLLSRRAVVRAKNEAVYGVAETFGANDGVLVAEPKFSADTDILERDFTRDTLSQQAHVTGRIMAQMDFRTELRSNGLSNSGIIGNAPILTRLFRACGYALTAHAASNAGSVYDVGDHTNPVTWATSGTLTNTDFVQYIITVTTGGASGTAQVTITSDTAGQGSAASALTTATPKVLGTLGLSITPTFTGSLVVGQQWVVWLFPPGLRLKPVSTNFESVTLDMNLDGVLHTMPGAFGTFELTAEAGKYASVNFNFMGNWVDPVDAAMSSPTYERTLPAQVELGRLRLENFAAICEKFSFNQNNDIQVRPDINSAQGYIGTRIVGRTPEGGVDPEADLVASYDFWGKLKSSRRMPFQMQIGRTAGNRIWLLGPSTQYTGLTHGDRQGIRTYDAGLKFSGYAGDDEFQMYFC